MCGMCGVCGLEWGARATAVAVRALRTKSLFINSVYQYKHQTTYAMNQCILNGAACQTVIKLHDGFLNMRTKVQSKQVNIRMR